MPSFTMGSPRRGSSSLQSTSTVISLLIFAFIRNACGLPFASLMVNKRVDAINQLPNAKSSVPAILMSPFSSPSPVSTSASSVVIPCDFETYDPSGCEDEEGSFCEAVSQKCLCKDGFSIRLLAYCLPQKEIGQDCYTSAQCSGIPNAACYIFGKEYDNERISGGHNVGRQVSNWPTGTCRCSFGYQWHNETGTCIKKLVGSWCNDDWDCIKEKFNTQCSRPQNLCECSWGYFYDTKTDSCQVPKLYGLKCLSDSECAPENLICSVTTSRCVCPSGFHFDVIKPGCKPNDDSSCDKGYKWDEEWGRCIPVRSAAAFPFNQLNQNRASSSSNNNNNNNNAVINSNSKNPDPTSGVNNLDDSSASSSFSTALILILPNVVAFALIMHYCYFRRREDDASDLDGGSLSIRSTHVHNLAKFCAYPPYGRSALIKGPACTGPFPGVPCCAAAGKLLAQPKLSVLESVAEEGRLDAGSEAGADSTVDPDDKEKGSVADGDESAAAAATADTGGRGSRQRGDDESSSPHPPPPPCSELNESSSRNGKQLENKDPGDVMTTKTSTTTTSSGVSESNAAPASQYEQPQDEEKAGSVGLVISKTQECGDETEPVERQHSQ